MTGQCHGDTEDERQGRGSSKLHIKAFRCRTGNTAMLKLGANTDTNAKRPGDSVTLRNMSGK